MIRLQPESVPLAHWHEDWDRQKHAKQGFWICHCRALSSKAETECLEQMRTTPRTPESAFAPTLFPKPQAFWKVWKLIGEYKTKLALESLPHPPTRSPPHGCSNYRQSVHPSSLYMGFEDLNSSPYAEIASLCLLISFFFFSRKGFSV